MLSSLGGSCRRRRCVRSPSVHESDAVIEQHHGGINRCCCDVTERDKHRHLKYSRTEQTTDISLLFPRDPRLETSPKNSKLNRCIYLNLVGFLDASAASLSETSKFQLIRFASDCVCFGFFSWPVFKAQRGVKTKLAHTACPRLRLTAAAEAVGGAALLLFTNTDQI